MKKIVYLDCTSGICGSMFVGALLDLGLEWQKLITELKKLGLSNYKLNRKKITDQGITGTLFLVDCEKEKKHRKFPEIEIIIKNSKLSQKVQKKVLEIFWLLAQAEGKIHNCKPSEIHFHEVGAVDAIIDITAVCLGLDLLGVEKIYSSAVHLGSGEMECAHGRLPIPAPATLELLRGLKCYSRGIEAELTTPTGAALLRGLKASFETQPKMCLEKIGYGAGERKLAIPNFLRIRLGILETKPALLSQNFEGLDDPLEQNLEKETLILLECGLDDLSPEILAYLRESLEENGALEVMVIPAQMKKGRSGHLLRVVSKPITAGVMQEIILRESSSLGVRKQSIKRLSLSRKTCEVSLKHGNVTVKYAYKKAKPKTISNISPEYESCKAYATKHDLALKKVYQEAYEAVFSQSNL